MKTTTQGPTDMNAIISARILAAKGAGMTTRQAIDAVLGEGTYAKLAGEVYDALRAAPVAS